MKCKFCNQNVKSKYLDFIKREVIFCDLHKPMKVHYKVSSRGSQWIISNNDYRLVYLNDQTFLQRYHPEAESVKDVYESVKKFDYDLKINPEDFNRKLKTILTFM